MVLIPACNLSSIMEYLSLTSKLFSIIIMSLA
jgi:hypothetical protein